MERLTPKVYDKKEAFKINQNIHLIEFKTLSSFEVQSPGSGFFGRDRINFTEGNKRVRTQIEEKGVETGAQTDRAEDAQSHPPAAPQHILFYGHQI